MAEKSWSAARRHPELWYASAANDKLLLADTLTVKLHLGAWYFRSGIFLLSPNKIACTALGHLSVVYKSGESIVPFQKQHLCDMLDGMAQQQLRTRARAVFACCRPKGPYDPPMV